MTITWTPLPPPQASAIPAQAQPIDVEAWTAAASEALSNVSISTFTPAPTRGTANALAIPLDEGPESAQAQAQSQRTADRTTLTRPRTPIRRDSLVRREALLKGREGTRRRMRWENDHLLSNPYAVPPAPTDWEIRPTHPRHGTVPYFLAPLWDADNPFKKSAEAKKLAAQKARWAQNNPSTSSPATSSAEKTAAVKELRAKLKRAKAARGLLQDLEEEVRRFVEGWERGRGEREKEKEEEEAAKGKEMGWSEGESDEEVVFVGRGGGMKDVPPSPTVRRGREKGEEGFVVIGDTKEEERRKREKMVFWSLEAEKGAGFGRWLVHSIATYYGLKTWSVTVGDPARREAYVGIDMKKTATGRGNEDMVSTGGLPRPLWGLV